MEYQNQKEDKSTQTFYTLVSYYPEEEELLPRLDYGTIISYECEDPFLQDYFNSYEKWEKDGQRFLNEEIVEKYIKTGEIPILNDGRPEMTEWFEYTTSTNVFIVEWGNSRVFAKNFIEKMLNIYKEHGYVPEYLLSKSQLVIELSEWEPFD